MHKIKCTICESERVNLYQRPDAPELFNLYCLDCRAHATVEPFEIEAAELARYKRLFENCWIWETPAEANHIESFTDNCYVRIPAGEFRHALELLKLEADGLLLALPCKEGDEMFSLRWNFKYDKYESHASKIKNVRSDSADGSITVSDGERFHVLGKTAFLTREAAEAALEGERSVKRDG